MVAIRTIMVDYWSSSPSSQVHDYNGLKWKGEVEVELGSHGETKLKLHGYNSNGQRVDKMVGT